MKAAVSFLRTVHGELRWSTRECEQKDGPLHARRLSQLFVSAIPRMLDFHFRAPCHSEAGESSAIPCRNAELSARADSFTVAFAPSWADIEKKV